MKCIGIHSFFPEELVDEILTDLVNIPKFLEEEPKIILVKLVLEAMEEEDTGYILGWQDPDGRILIADSDLDRYVENLVAFIITDIEALDGEDTEATVADEDAITSHVHDCVVLVDMPLTGYKK